MNNMNQEIKYIKIQDLVLWTENPRDPISPDASDQDVVNRALLNSDSTWDIEKLAKNMGEFYDFSELPTVVYEGGKPIVYDGNRRIILGKIYHGLVESNVKIDFLPEFPFEIPCNVCDKIIALKSILRKHGDSGSWKPLERDYFIDKYDLGDKSDFLIIDEATGIISENPILNQGFVRKEILNPSNLTKLGIKIEAGTLVSQHSKSELRAIFEDIINQIRNKKITTRNSRGKSFEVLSQKTKDIIENNRDKDFSLAPRLNNVEHGSESASRICKNDDSPVSLHVTRKTKRINEPDIPFFGKELYLKKGNVNNLYRDILDLHRFYKSQKLTKSFSSILRMALRLLCETANSSRKSSDVKPYVMQYFDEAKKQLDQNQKTLLASQNVTKDSLTQLLQTGAHGYRSSQNYEQTLAISIILGAMLTISHGKEVGEEEFDAEEV